MPDTRRRSPLTGKRAPHELSFATAAGASRSRCDARAGAGVVDALEVSDGAHRDRTACRPFVGGGLRDSVHARCESGQVASCAYELVLRNIRSRATSARVPGVSSSVSRAVQLLLQQYRRQASAPPARFVVAAVA